MFNYTRLASLVIGIASIFTSSIALAVGPQDNADSLHCWLQTRVTKGFQGQVILERDGVVALDHVYGAANESLGIPATTESLYYIGSLAKMFTSAAILQLDVEKKLNLSGKIGLYLDDVPKDKAKITIKHLLSHTSGIIANHTDPFVKLDRDEFVDWCLATPLDHKPGKQHQYSNVAYSLLAAIIEQVDGGSFEASLHRRVFKPAGMNDTFFLNEITPHLDRVAIGHGPKLIEYKLDGKPENYGGSWLRVGPGGIVSTARDLMS